MGKYKFMLTLKKVGVQAVIVAIAGCASVYADNPVWLAIAPIANGFLNWLKHHKDGEFY